MNPRSFASRRRFLQTTALAAGATAFGSPAVLSARSPNSKMNVACIAAGGRGGSHVGESKKMADLVDDPEVFTETLAGGLAGLSDPAYRAMLEAVSPAISAAQATRSHVRTLAAASGDNHCTGGLPVKRPIG